ncbi:MAG: DUF2520 domain-containing protein [Chloroflexi bacterium]|nr:DUF2520 domain-containing protein [Chloroflexota bacterium]
MTPPTLAFVGAGRAATGLGRALFDRGWRIESVCSHGGESARRLAESVGARPVLHASDITGDLVIVSVPDGAIADAAGQLAAAPSLWEGRGVVHTSGATGIQALNALAERGAMIGGLHPAYPFSADPSVTPNLNGVTFAAETQDDLLSQWLTALVDSLGGTVLTLPPEARPIYHAALVFASNYTITLIALAGRLMESFGAAAGPAKGALDALVAGMVENVRRDGATAALPGPLVRADVGTIEAHMRALRWLDPDAARLYAELARATYPILRARGVPPHKLEEILRVLGEDEIHAKHDS